MCTYWNRVSFKKSTNQKQKKIDSIGIGLASPEEIRSWGERRLPNGTLIGKVDKDHTVDYESLKPIEGGLFCERIFGPVEDFYCSCERRGEKNEKFCPTCEVEFTRSQVRRTRMGYIPLAVPVAHVWYLRGRPSYIANLIGKTRNTVDKLAYGETLCESFIDATYQQSLPPNFSQQSTQHLMESSVLNFDISNKENLQLCNLTSFASPLTFFTLQGPKETKNPYSEGVETSFDLRRSDSVDASHAKQPLYRRPEGTKHEAGRSVDAKLTSYRPEGAEKGHTKEYLRSGHLGYSKSKDVSSQWDFYPSPALLTLQQVKTFQNGSFTSLTKLNQPKGYKTLEKLYFASLTTPDNQKIFLVRNLHTWQFFYAQLLEKAYTPFILKAVTYFSHQPNDVFGKKSFTNFRAIFKRLHLGCTFGASQRGKASKNFELCYPINRFLRKDDLLFSEKLLANTDKEVKRRLPPQVKDQLNTFYVNQSIGELKKNKNVSTNQTNTFISKDVVPEKKELSGSLTFLGYSKSKDTSSQRDSYLLPQRGTSFARPNSARAFQVDRLGVQEVADKNQSFLGKYTKFHTLPIFSTFIYKEWSHRFSFLEYFIWSARENDLALPFYTQKGTCHKMRKNSVNWIRNRLVSSLIPQGYKESPLNKPTILPFWGRSKIQVKNKTTVITPVSPEGVRAFLDGNQPAFTHNSIGSPSPKRLGLVLPLGGIARYPQGVRKQLIGSQESPENETSIETPLTRTVMSSVPFLLRNEIAHFLQLRNKKTTLVCGVASNNIHASKMHIITYVEQDLTSAQNRLSLFRQKRNIFIWESIASYSVDASHAHPKGMLTSYRPEGAEEGYGLGKLKEGVRVAPLLIPQSGKEQLKIAPSLTPSGLERKRQLPQGVGYANGNALAETPSAPQAHTPLGYRGKGLASQAKHQKGTTKDGPETTQGCSSALKSSIMAQESNAWKNASYNGHGDQVPFSNPFGVRGEVEDTQQFPRLAELLHFTGGTALRHLLGRFDLALLSKFLRYELKNLELKVNLLLALKILTYSQGLLLGKLAKRRSKQIRRLKLLELFQSQKSNPKWMILSILPVLPPDLRPILRVNDDFVVASDLNRLYQTVLRRNNTIHERLDDPLPCPESGLFRQRSLQKAVDGLLENGKGGGTPLCASKRRPLVSLSHVLKGKKGLFRQHLLGKRVDYSGRSVIVVGPKLNLHECGLPKEMALELFQPFLIHRLKIKGLAISNTAARRMIQQEDPAIWHIIKQLVYEHPVLLNRAPTLHRLGIQAFQPRLVSGRAILLHPLVCNGFNADFDGDQMAVHVPLSFQARAEAWKIMWSKNNLLSPATGQPILVPSQDMVLGCYYLSVFIPRVIEYKKSFNLSQVTSASAVNSFNDQSQSFEIKGNKVQTKESLDAPLYNLAFNLTLPQRSLGVQPSYPYGVSARNAPSVTPLFYSYEGPFGCPCYPVTPKGYGVWTKHRAKHRLSTGLASQAKHQKGAIKIALDALQPVPRRGNGLLRKHNQSLFGTDNPVASFGFFKKTQHISLLSDTTLLKNIAAFHRSKARNNVSKKNFFGLSTQLKGNVKHQKGSILIALDASHAYPEGMQPLPRRGNGLLRKHNQRVFGCRASHIQGRRIQDVTNGLYSERAKVSAFSVYRTPYELKGYHGSSEKLRLEKEEKIILVTPFNLARVSALLRQGYQNIFLNNVLVMEENTRKIDIPERVFDSTNLINSNFSAAFLLPLQGRDNQLASTSSYPLRGMCFASKVYDKEMWNNYRKTFSGSFGLLGTVIPKGGFNLKFSPLSLYDFYICSRFRTPLSNNMSISCSLKLWESFDALTFHSVASHPNPSTQSFVPCFVRCFVPSGHPKGHTRGHSKRYRVVKNKQVGNLTKGDSAFIFALNRIFFFPLTFQVSKSLISTQNERVTHEPWHSPTKKTHFAYQLERGHYFSSLQDSLIAYSQGRLQTHTPFWVRVNSLIINEQGLPVYPEKVKKELQLINAEKPLHSKGLVNFSLIPPVAKQPKRIYTSFDPLDANRRLKEGVRLDKKQQFKETIKLPFQNVHFDIPTAPFLPRGLEEVKTSLNPLDLQSRSKMPQGVQPLVARNALSETPKGLAYPLGKHAKHQRGYEVSKASTEGLSSLTPKGYKESKEAAKRVEGKKKAEEDRLAPYPLGGPGKYNDAKSSDSSSLLPLTPKENKLHKPVDALHAKLTSYRPEGAEKGYGITVTTKENVKIGKDLFFGYAYTNVTKISYDKTKNLRNDQDISELTYGKANSLACRRTVKLPQASQVLTNSSEFALFQLRFGFSKELCKVLFQKNHYKTIIETNDVVELPLELRLSADGNLIKVLTTFQNHYNCAATVLDQCQENCIKYMRTTAGRVVINEALFYTS